MISTNVAWYFFITQQAVAQMRKQKSGHIVSISTTLTDQPLAGAPISLPRPDQGNHSGVQPGLGDGICGRRDSGQHDLAGVVKHPDAREQRPRIPKNAAPDSAAGEVSEIVDAVLYLQSAPMVNGENIRIDGGAHAGAKW